MPGLSWGRLTCAPKPSWVPSAPIVHWMSWCEGWSAGSFALCPGCDPWAPWSCLLPSRPSSFLILSHQLVWEMPLSLWVLWSLPRQHPSLLICVSPASLHLPHQAKQMEWMIWMLQFCPARWYRKVSTWGTVAWRDEEDWILLSG